MWTRIVTSMVAIGRYLKDSLLIAFILLRRLATHKIKLCKLKKPKVMRAKPTSDALLPPKDSMPPGVMIRLNIKPLKNMPYNEKSFAFAYIIRVVMPPVITAVANTERDKFIFRRLLINATIAVIVIAGSR